MTDKPTPTDAELKALLLDKLPASKHYIRPVIEKMVAAMQAAIDKWGQPAQAAEPVAWLDPWTGTKVTTDYDAYGKLESVDDAMPFPVARQVLKVARARLEGMHGIKGGNHENQNQRPYRRST